MSETRQILADLLTEQARKNLSMYIPLVHKTSENKPAFPPAHIKDILVPILMDDSLGHTVIVAPPESAKTATMLATCCWWIGRDPNVRIGYISSTAAQAEKRSVAIRDTLVDNPSYTSIFPDIQPDMQKGWKKMEWYVKRSDRGNKDATLLASGAPGPILGSRFDRVILDDIADPENMSTKNQQEKIKTFLKDVVMTRVVPTGRVIMIATRWSANDPVQWAIDQGWHYVHIPAIYENGESYWPDYWPLSRLRCPGDKHAIDTSCCKFRQVGSRSFVQHYLGKVADESSSLIKRDYWQFYSDKDEISKRILKGGIFVDVAHTVKSYSDYSVITVMGTDGVNFYVLDMWRKQVEFPELEKQCIFFRNKYLNYPMYIEASPGSLPLIQRLKQSTNRIIPWRIAGTDKVARVNSCLPLLEAKNVFLPVNAPWVEVTMTEAALFPSGEHDDIVDTISMGLNILSAKKRVITAS